MVHHCVHRLIKSKIIPTTDYLPNALARIITTDPNKTILSAAHSPDPFHLVFIGTF